MRGQRQFRLQRAGNLRGRHHDLADARPPGLRSATSALTRPLCWLRCSIPRLPSMTGMFATEEIVADAIERSRKKGVLAGEGHARVFAWLRPNDLVWNYWVNNYLMGEQAACVRHPSTGKWRD